MKSQHRNRITTVLLMVLGMIAFTTAGWGDFFAEVVETKGVAELQKAEMRQKGLTDKWKPLSPMEEIFLADTIRTGATGKVKALVEYQGIEAVWSLFANGSMYFDEEEPFCNKSKRILHLEGTVRGAVSKRSATAPELEAGTDNARICVPGTTFILRSSPPDTTGINTTEIIPLEGVTVICNLKLAEGQVAEKGECVEVKQGYSSQVVETRAPTAPKLLSPVALKRAQELRITAQVHQTVHPRVKLLRRLPDEEYIPRVGKEPPFPRGIYTPDYPSPLILLQIEFPNPNQ
jgi:hypothetical protein